MNKLLLIGGGRHCLAVIDSLNREEFEEIGITDIPDKVGNQINDVPIIGCDDDLEVLRDRYSYAFISLGSIGNWHKRERILRILDKFDYTVISITHPSSVLTLPICARGIFVGSGAIVNDFKDIGEMCILNSGCIVEHQCKIDPFAHIAPGAVLCGGVTVGKGSHIGAGSVVRENITIGENVLIGAGSVVVKNIPANVIAYGNPCRVVTQRDLTDDPKTINR